MIQEEHAPLTRDEAVQALANVMVTRARARMKDNLYVTGGRTLSHEERLQREMSWRAEYALDILTGRSNPPHRCP